jgi:hypothetical protein
MAAPPNPSLLSLRAVRGVKSAVTGFLPIDGQKFIHSMIFLESNVDGRIFQPQAMKPGNSVKFLAEGLPLQSIHHMKRSIREEFTDDQNSTLRPPHFPS